MMGRHLTPESANPSSTKSFRSSSPSMVENVTSAPAARRCLATMAAPPIKSTRLSKRTLGVGVLVTLGKKVGLDARDVVERRGIEIDQHKIDHFERREIECAQLLGHERTVLRLGDVRVRGKARDQDISLFLGVEQMANVAR